MLNMLKCSFLILLGTICNMYPVPQVVVDKSRIDAVFVQWNKATLRSLATQEHASPDSIKKAAYINRAWGIKLYWNIAAPDSINKQSIRYLFLKEFFVEDSPKEAYVVEANSVGAKITLRNFVIYKDNLGNFQAQLYMYFEKKWQKRQRIQLATCQLDHDLSKFILKPGRGFNSDDIIISRFIGKAHNVAESEYYLSGTLAIDSGIKAIIDNAY